MLAELFETGRPHRTGAYLPMVSDVQSDKAFNNAAATNARKRFFYCIRTNTRKAVIVQPVQVPGASLACPKAPSPRRFHSQFSPSATIEDGGQNIRTIYDYAISIDPEMLYAI